MIITNLRAEPWDIVVYPLTKGKYDNNIFIFNEDLNIVNISLEFEGRTIGGTYYYKEPVNQILREFAHHPEKRYFHDGEGYAAPNGQTGIIILKYREWKKWILTQRPDNTLDFYNFIEKKCEEITGNKYKVFVRYYAVCNVAKL